MKRSVDLVRRAGWNLALALLLWIGTAGASDSAAETAPSPALLSEESTAAQTGATAADSTSRDELAESLVAYSDSVDESYFAIMAKLGLGLGLVVLLAWGTVWLLRKSSLGQQFGAVGSAVRVVERTFLGPKKAIYLVEIGDRTLALGVTEENIALLAEWPAGELIVASPDPRSSNSFGIQFKTLLGQLGKPAQEEQGP